MEKHNTLENIAKDAKIEESFLIKKARIIHNLLAQQGSFEACYTDRIAVLAQDLVDKYGTDSVLNNPVYHILAGMSPEENRPSVSNKCVNAELSLLMDYIEKEYLQTSK